MKRLALCVVVGSSLGAQALPRLSPGKCQWDLSTEFTSRGGLPLTASGRIATHFPSGYWLGTERIASFGFVVQDQDAATQESFTFEVRRQDPSTGMPDWPANPGAPILALVHAIPPGQGPVAWSYTVTPAQPLLLPQGEPFYLAWELPSAPNWVADGLSLHMGAGSPVACGVVGNPTCCGLPGLPTLGGWERPRGHAPTGSQGNIENLSVSDAPAGGLAFGTVDRTYAHWLQSTTPVLQKLASDPSQFCANAQPNGGHAAMDPDVDDALALGRNDDIGWHVDGGAAYTGGTAWVFLSRTALGRGRVHALGEIWIDFTDPLTAAAVQGPVALGTRGAAEVFLALGPPGSPLRHALATAGNLHAQAVVLDATASRAALTNLDTTRFPWPAGTPFQITASAPRLLTLAGARAVQVQNDGNGDVRVELLDQAGATLRTLVVRERTTGSTDTVGGIPAAAVQARLATRNQDALGQNPTRGRFALLP